MDDSVREPNRSSKDEFVRLVEAHQLSLLQLCFVYLHDKTLAEDAIQETFLKAYRSFSGFRRESSEKTWLSRIAINCCRDLNKSGWYRFFNRSFSAEILPVSSEYASEKDDDLTVAVMKLPVRLREVILLYYFEDMTTVEIAEVLCISQQAVSARLSRALIKLRKELGESFEGDEANAK